MTHNFMIYMVYLGKKKCYESILWLIANSMMFLKRVSILAGLGTTSTFPDLHLEFFYCMLRQKLSTTKILVDSVSIGCPLCMMFVCHLFKDFLSRQRTAVVQSILVPWKRHYLWPVVNSECSNMSENLSVDFQQDRECLYPTVSLHLDFLHIWHISCAHQVTFL